MDKKPNQELRASDQKKLELLDELSANGFAEMRHDCHTLLFIISHHQLTTEDDAMLKSHPRALHTLHLLHEYLNKLAEMEC